MQYAPACLCRCGLHAIVGTRKLAETT
jgi:hypothetical protein